MEQRNLGSWWHRAVPIAMLVCGLVAGADAQEAHSLEGGAVLSTQSPWAWVSGADGHVRALDLRDGAERWRSAVRGRPLLLEGGRLWVLSAPNRAGQLQLSLLDASSGEFDSGRSLELPEQVVATPEAAPARRFEVVSLHEGNGWLLAWRYLEYPLRGAPMQGVGTQPIALEAAFRIDPTSGAGTALAMAFPGRELGPAERLPQLEGAQFASADGLHVNRAVALADPGEGWRWRWQVYARAGSRDVGGFTLPYSSAPFLVQGGVAYVLTEAWTRLPDQAQGRRLRAIRLGDGNEIWSVALAETHWRGALPP